MRIAIATGGVYEPEWEGNRDQPEDERIRVHYRFLTYAERAKYIYTKPLRVGRDGEVGGIELVQDVEGIAKAMIQRIEGLEVEIEGKVESIDTAGKLYSTKGVPYALVSEIQTFCLSATPEVRKNPTG